MAVGITAPAPSACDVLATVRDAVRELNSWAGHLEAYLLQGQAGQAQQAARVAAIVTATLEAAACDTRAVARAALETAFENAA